VQNFSLAVICGGACEHFFASLRLTQRSSSNLADAPILLSGTI
jgi:hypothetical protein